MEPKDFITTEYKFDGHKSECKESLENYVKKFLSDLFKRSSLSKTKFVTVTKAIFKKKLRELTFRYSVFINPKDDTIDLKISTSRESKLNLSKIYSYPIKDGNIKTYEKFVFDSANNFYATCDTLEKL